MEKFCVCVFEGYKQYMIECEKYDQILVDYERESSKNKIRICLLPHPYIIVGRLHQKKAQKSLSACFLWLYQRKRSKYHVPKPYRAGLGGQSWFGRLLFKFRWLKILKIESPRCDPRTCFKKEDEWKEVSDELSLLIVCVHSTGISIWANVPRLAHSHEVK